MLLSYMYIYIEHCSIWIGVHAHSLLQYVHTHTRTSCLTVSRDLPGTHQPEYGSIFKVQGVQIRHLQLTAKSSDFSLTINMPLHSW